MGKAELCFPQDKGDLELLSFFLYHSLLVLVFSSVTLCSKGLLLNPSLVEGCFSYSIWEHLKDKSSSEVESKNLNLILLLAVA